jgi:hypothetical protein
VELEDVERARRVREDLEAGDLIARAADRVVVAFDEQERLVRELTPVDAQLLQIVRAHFDDARLEHDLARRLIERPHDLGDLGHDARARRDDESVAALVDLDLLAQRFERFLGLGRVRELEIHDVRGQAGLVLQGLRVRDEDRVADAFVGQARGAHDQVHGLVDRHVLHVDRQLAGGDAGAGHDVEVALLGQHLEHAWQVRVLGIQRDELARRSRRSPGPQAERAQREDGREAPGQFRKGHAQSP